MIAVLCWLACGVAAGFFMNRVISESEKSLTPLTIGVGVAGAMLGGFGGSYLGLGATATGAFLGMVCAAIGASLTLIGYRWLIGA
jgi:uncharacterized membrane protein YeaQ/YmgE (transglycosylase-associated protein family)